MDDYMNPEARERRSRDAKELEEIVSKIRPIIYEVNKAIRYEKSYFSNIFNDTHNRLYPEHKADMKYTLQSYKYAYKALLHFQKQSFWSKVKLYRKSGWNR